MLKIELLALICIVSGLRRLEAIEVLTKVFLFLVSH